MMVVVYILAGVGVLAILAGAAILLLALVLGAEIPDEDANPVERQDWRHNLSHPIACEKCGHETVCVVCEKHMRSLLARAGLPPRRV